MNELGIYLLTWLLLILPMCFIFKWQDMKGWDCFWCAFWWPITFPFLLIALPFYFLNLFVEKYLK